ncbi:MAG: CDP-glucose 4,6-dehydratase [Prolixibacteraceae bacterium]
MFNQLSAYKGKTVLVTGNTGFKGSWMTMMLLHFKANVVGYALQPEVNGKPVYDELRLNDKVNQYIEDIRSYKEVKKCIEETQPDIIFHMAAQPLVRESYQEPYATLDVNIMGTLNLLEAVRKLKLQTKIICITSDKSYQNQEWLFGYRENDPLGGNDPYSASKAAAEIIISSYRNSFFNPEKFAEHGVMLASVRAGNVIGGGDWADDRIVPDSIRSLKKGEKIFVRNPLATRPWQHVLEPTGGYLLLGAKMFENESNAETYCSAFNFGPLISSNLPVQALVDEIIHNWGSGEWTYNPEDAVHEASLLNLTIEKAYHLLDWFPVWDFKDGVKHTTEWYKQQFNGGDMVEFTNKQIVDYIKTYELRDKDKTVAS